MMSRDMQLRLCILLLVLNLLFIWGNSLLPADVSKAFSDWAHEMLDVAQTEAVSEAGTGLLRKAAHFTEFTVLGLLLSWLFRLLRKKCWQVMPWGVVVACVDETIQAFIPGRGPGILDVAIDTCGILAGILLLQTGYVLLRRKQLQSGG